MEVLLVEAPDRPTLVFDHFRHVYQGRDDDFAREEAGSSVEEGEGLSLGLTHLARTFEQKPERLLAFRVLENLGALFEAWGTAGFLKVGSTRFRTSAKALLLRSH